MYILAFVMIPVMMTFLFLKICSCSGKSGHYNFGSTILWLIMISGLSGSLTRWIIDELKGFEHGWMDQLAFWIAALVSVLAAFGICISFGLWLCCGRKKNRVKAR